MRNGCSSYPHIRLQIHASLYRDFLQYFSLSTWMNSQILRLSLFQSLIPYFDILILPNSETLMGNAHYTQFIFIRQKQHFRQMIRIKRITLINNNIFFGKTMVLQHCRETVTALVQNNQGRNESSTSPLSTSLPVQEAVLDRLRHMMGL